MLRFGRDRRSGSRDAPQENLSALPHADAFSVAADTDSRSLAAAARNDFADWNENGYSPPALCEQVRDWLQSVGISQHEDYLIHPSVEAVRMGLGWSKGVDVDAAVALFDAHLRLVDVVWYRQLRSKCGSVMHSGDNLTGEGEGDDEVITVQLSKLPPHVHHLLFTVSVYSFQVSFAEVKSAYARMMHGNPKHKNHELCHFSLTDMSGHATLVGVLTRKGAYWNFRALGTPATGRTVMELLQNPRNIDCLSAVPSHDPELRRVTVTVVKGTRLAAKDGPGLLRKSASSDPYHIIQFGKKVYTSNHIKQTLKPEWKCPAFEMGWLTEVDTEPLVVQIFDYDALGSDDFMGEIRVPGHSLYALGVGEYTFWFTLSHSKDRKYRDQDVSGKVLLHFRVELPAPVSFVGANS